MNILVTIMDIILSNVSCSTIYKHLLINYLPCHSLLFESIEKINNKSITYQKNVHSECPIKIKSTQSRYFIITNLFVNIFIS